MKNILSHFFLTSTFVGIGYNSSKFLIHGIGDTKRYVDNVAFRDYSSVYILYAIFGVPICTPYLFYGTILGSVQGLVYPVLLPSKYLYEKHIKRLSA